MDKNQDKVFHLIQYNDPTKVRIPINEKFSKLTLSSNKKKQEAKLQQPPPNPIDDEQRKSASRNLFETTKSQTEDEEIKEKSDEPRPPQEAYVNPLVRSDNSNESDSRTTAADSDEARQKLCPYSVLREKLRELNASNMAMEALQLSSDDEKDSVVNVAPTKEPDAVEMLTQKVSRLSMVLKQEEDKPTSPNDSQMTEDVSGQSNILTIDITSSGSEEEGSENGELSAITISDTSDEEQNANENTECGTGVDYMITSDVGKSGETEDNLLPCTLSNDKVDRIEAFLNDVYEQQQEMLANKENSPDVGDINESSMSDRKPPSPQKLKSLAAADTDPMTESLFSSNGVQTERDPESEGNNKNLNDSVSRRAEKAHRLASAETEPVTSEEAENIPESKTLATNLQDTLSMSQTDSSFLFKTRSSIQLNKSYQTQIEFDSKAEQNRNPKSLANNDTELNTQNFEESSEGSQVTQIEIEESIEEEIVCSEQHGNSVIISETSTESHHLEDSAKNTTESVEIPSSPEQNTEPVDSNQVRQSDEVVSSEATSLETQSPQIGVSIGSISISAKINIQIQLSGLSVSSSASNSSDDGNDDDSSPSKKASDTSISEEAKGNDEASTNSSANTSRKLNGSPAPKQTRKMKTPTKTTQKKGSAKESLENTASEKVQNMTPKPLSLQEKLLNEIYGNTWRTPEVVRELETITKSCKKAATLEAEFKIPKTNTKNSKKKIVNSPKPVVTVDDEENNLDDFSIFRRNIERTNLDSTRLNAQNQQSGSRKPVQSNKKISNEEKQPGTPRIASEIKTPNTDYRQRVARIRKVPGSNSVKSGKWRNIIDSDSGSEGADASDDSDADKSDESWRQSDEDLNESIEKPTRKKNNSKKQGNTKKDKSSDLIYLDLTKDHVTICEGEPPESPPANHDDKFKQHLQDILQTCRPADKPRLVATPPIGSDGKKVGGRRRLFNNNFGNELEEILRKDESPKQTRHDYDPEESGEIRFNGPLLNIFNKRLESVKKGKPIFELTPPSAKSDNKNKENTPLPKKTPKSSTKSLKSVDSGISSSRALFSQVTTTPCSKYGFLKSLDVCATKALCHPDSLRYRDNYKQTKEELSKLLYDLYNEKLFQNELEVPLVWNKKLLNTAGRCLNKKRMGKRTSVIELSEKVLTSADRLRCTLIHEMCHAATWIFDGEGGHGATWKQWARKANSVFPELPKIGVCHQYDIEYKYTYKCTLCAAKSYFHSKSKKVENIRCSYCHGAIEIYLNKKDKAGNVMHTPVREPTGFAKFVKDKYKEYKRPDLKHADVMKILSNEFAALKVAGKT